ncbi:MAG: cobalamin biosynthesis protein CbiX [Variovorax sp.]|nr:cobalamin biosynthesis protein CbiX [Variovorax sp.]
MPDARGDNTDALTGIVLFAHGSRDARWREPVEAIARRLVELAPAAPVVCAYLELMAPGLPVAAAGLVAKGVSAVRIVPLFLGIGKHVREDLPGLVDGLRAAHPGVAFSLQTAVGEDARVIELLAQIALRG